MFWNIVLGIGAVASVVGIGRAIEREHEAGAGKGGKKPIAPAGVPQPSGVVAVPPSAGAVDGDPLHTAARAALTALKTTPPSQAFVAAVQAFQHAYNATKPPTALKEDGQYGSKTQAALQSVISPAIAPQATHGSTTGLVTVALPPIAAAQAFPGQVAVTGAANVLLGMGAIGKASDARVATFQHSYNLTPGVLHLVEDGKYGGSTEGALQAVADYIGAGGLAPRNPFGTKVPAPAYPPATDTIELG